MESDGPATLIVDDSFIHTTLRASGGINAAASFNQYLSPTISSGRSFLTRARTTRPQRATLHTTFSKAVLRRMTFFVADCLTPGGRLL